MTRPGRTIHSAFTLVELLVVIAILSLLSALVVPTIRLVWAQMKNGKCAGNLHTLYLGMTIYELDHGRHPMNGPNIGDGYARNNFLFQGFSQPARDRPGNQGPSGYMGLGQLVGRNRAEGQSSLTYAEQLEGAYPERHFKYVSKPDYFYCPLNEGGGTRNKGFGVWEFMQWPHPWTDWPTSENYELWAFAGYSLRYTVNTRCSPPLEDEAGLNIGPKAGDGRKFVVERAFTIIDPTRLIKGEAVLSDAQCSGLIVPEAHETGVNVAYRNGSVSFYEDDEKLLTDKNPVAYLEGKSTWPPFGPHNDYDQAQVAIWKDYDAKFDP